jgi:hypothetical protein
MRLIIILAIVFAFVWWQYRRPSPLTSTNDVPRVSEAFGSIGNLGHPANMNEVSAITRQWIIQSTQDYERRKNMALFTPTPMEMQPTPTPTPTPGLRVAEPAKAAPQTPAPKPTATPKKKK